MSKKKHSPGEADKPESGANSPTSVSNARAMPSLGIDWNFYMAMLEESDATDDEKRELIQTLWNIVLAFVDLGYGVHPIQQACEQNEVSKQISALDWDKMINLDHSSKPAFGQSADPKKEPPRAGSKT